MLRRLNQDVAAARIGEVVGAVDQQRARDIVAIWRQLRVDERVLDMAELTRGEGAAPTPIELEAWKTALCAKSWTGARNADAVRVRVAGCARYGVAVERSAVPDRDVVGTKAVLTDAQLASLTGTNGRVRYVGCSTHLGHGRSMAGSMGVHFAFAYVLRPDQL